MSHQISSVARDALTPLLGVEPVLVVEIFWGGTFCWFATRQINNVNGNIISVGGLKNQKRVDSQANTSSVEITFSDTDGEMKSICDNFQVERAPAAIYLATSELSASDFVTIMIGEVVGPIKWSEGNRTFTLGIESTCNSHEFGYSATIAEFPDINPEAAGVPWPCIFGKCAHVPSLHVRKHTVGYLQCEIQLYMNPAYLITPNNKDFWLKSGPEVNSFATNDAPTVKGFIYIEDGGNFPQNKEIQIVIKDVLFTGTFISANTFQVKSANDPKYVNVQFDNRDPLSENWQNHLVAWLQDPSISLVNHHCYIHTVANQRWYNYCIRQEGAQCWFRTAMVSPITHQPFLLTRGNSIDAVYGISINGMTRDIAWDVEKFKQRLGARPAKPNKNPFGELVARIVKFTNDPSSWWDAKAETEVRLWDQQDPDIYLCSIATMKSVDAVFGKRKISLQDGTFKVIMQQIPPSYYEIQLQSNYAVSPPYPHAPELYPTAVLFYRALSDYAGQDWEDGIWVTGVSSIGPNICDIISWTLTSFTDSIMDQGSFGGVFTKVAVRPANFAVFDKRDALRMSTEMALQARCALRLDSARISIVFLADPPFPAITFTESNVEFQSLELGFTSTMELCTKLVASWTETYRDKKRLSQVHQIKRREFEHVLNSFLPSSHRTKVETKYLIRQENVGPYGMHVKEEAVYIYNQVEGVEDFLNFWGHRWANSWRLVKLKGFIECIGLQPFDGVFLNFSTGIIEAIVGVVDSVEFNYNEMTVSVGIWLPSISGTHGTDSNAFPGSDMTGLFPTLE